MVTIREARGEDFPRVYPLLLRFNNKGLRQEHWQQLFVDHSGLQNDRFGWVLDDGGEVVGFVGTILSERTVRGQKVRLCNTSSWIVRDEYRAHSLALHAKVLADPTVCVTNLSPTPQVLKLLGKMRFTLMDKSERIIVPVVTPRTLADRCQVITRPAQLERILSGEALRFFRDHQLPYNRHALLRSREGDCYLMMNRSLKIVAGKLRLPFARVHHIGAPDVFTRHTEKVAARLALALKVVGLIVDERMLRGRIPWHSFARPGGRRTAAFRSDVLTATDVDGLYTEAVLLNY
jgi:acetoacetyl-CoA synthetase